jgi:hypothetical protein
MKLKINITGLLLFFSITAFPQTPVFKYKRDLVTINNTWHSLVLPDEIYSKTKPDLTDIRIYGITEGNDTIEAAYLWETLKKEISTANYKAAIINKSYTKDTYFFTIKLPKKRIINKIHLNFNNKNFDWKLKLEGSQNQKEWFTLTDNYRLVSMHNNATNYTFTDIIFPDSDYQYFRISIYTKENVELINADIKTIKTNTVPLKTYSINKQQITNDKKKKKTIITIDLKMPVPVDHLKFDIIDQYDYYRPISIKYLTDSIVTKTNTIYNYKTLYKGTLSSLETKAFGFNRSIVKKLQIVIDNNDNQALNFKNFSVQGSIKKMLIRFTNPQAKYSLFYGNNSLQKPQYELSNFKTNIPDNLKELNLGEEQIISQKTNQTDKALFQNNIWLWIIMGIVIILLGGFTINMIRYKN